VKHVMCEIECEKKHFTADIQSALVTAWFDIFPLHYYILYIPRSFWCSIKFCIFIS